MRILKDNQGYAMVELLVALGIMTMVAGILSMVVFQIGKITNSAVSKTQILQDVRNTGTWLYIDGGKADTTDLIDGAPPNATMKFNWNEGSLPHSASYTLIDGDLTRDHDGTVHSVARNVSNVEFSLQGRLITASITSSTGSGSLTKQAVFKIWLGTTF